jgi:hypothetical protein
MFHGRRADSRREIEMRLTRVRKLRRSLVAESDLVMAFQTRRSAPLANSGVDPFAPPRNAGATVEQMLVSEIKRNALLSSSPGFEPQRLLYS